MQGVSGVSKKQETEGEAAEGGDKAAKPEKSEKKK